LVKNITGIQQSPYTLNISDVVPGTYTLTIEENGKRLRAAKMVKL
jgi:hypothetical protein